MTKARACALSIAGLDPGGGAGILADARAFVAAGAFPCAALAVITVQSTAGMRSARALAASEMIAQIDEVVQQQNVRAIKTGALGSSANVLSLAAWLRAHPELPVVVDPVMAATRSTGAKTASKTKNALLQDDALAAMRDALVPRATVVTANAGEAARLTGTDVRSEADAKRAATTLLQSGARAALVKGGHLDTQDAVDVLAIGDRIVTLRAPRLPGGTTAWHGGGCALASLIAGRLAVRAAERAADDAAIIAAVRWAKRVHHAAFASAVTVGVGARVLLY